MIIDNLDSFKNYLPMHKSFSVVEKFMEENDLDQLSPGKHKINEDVFVISEKVSGKKKNEGVLEAHYDFIDVQLCRNSVDNMGWRSHTECKDIKEVYDPERDIVFYNDAISKHISISRENFVVFFPWDAHAPNIGEGELHKIVFKVRL